MTKKLTSSLAIAVAMAGMTSQGIAANTVNVIENANLPVASSRVWATVKDFDGLQNWHPYIATSVVTQGESNKKGAIRTLTTKDGGKVIEELLNYDPKKMTYSYRMNEAPMPVSNFVATITVAPAGNGTTLKWAAQFSANEGTKEEDARKMVEGFLKAGIDSLKAKLN